MTAFSSTGIHSVSCRDGADDAQRVWQAFSCRTVGIVLAASLAIVLDCPAQVFPGTTWQFKTPAEVGMDVKRLDAFRDYIGGRGCVARHGYISSSRPWRTAGWPVSTSR